MASLVLAFAAGNVRGAPLSTIAAARVAAPELTDLSGTNPELRKLRQEIARNLRSTARRGELDRPLRFVRYRVQRNDNFFTIMAKVSQSPDTLASANELLNPNALLPGQELLVPNARGLFIRGSTVDQAAREYRVDPQNLVIVELRGPDGERAPGARSGEKKPELLFLPGGHYGAIQLQYFRGEGFLQPLKTGRVSSRFGMRSDPFTRRATFHGGLDIAAPKGTPVYASRDGVVSHAGKAGGYGQLVILDHRYDYQTYYGHLSRVEVKRGQRVRAGQLIGRVGATGRATGNHLHFELRKKGIRKKPTFIHRGTRQGDGVKW